MLAFLARYRFTKESNNRNRISREAIEWNPFMKRRRYENQIFLRHLLKEAPLRICFVLPHKPLLEFI